MIRLLFPFQKNWRCFWRITLAIYSLLFLANVHSTLAATPLDASGQGKPRAFLCIVIDDLKNLNLWTELADDSKTYGFTTTIALDTGKVKPEDWTVLATRVVQGHEVASHTRSHVPLATEAVIRLRRYTSNTKSAFATVDEINKKLSISDNGAPVLDLDLSKMGPNATLGRLVEVINRSPGCAAELVDPYYANIRSEFLASSASVDIFFKAGFAPLFLDQARHIRYELTESKQDIEANLAGYACKTIVYPFLSNNAKTRNIARELGFESGRTGSAGNYSLSSPGGYDLFQIWSQKPKILFGKPTAPDFTDRVKSFLKDMKSKQGAGCLYSHGPDEFTNEEWRALLKILATDPDIRVGSIREMAQYVKDIIPSR